MGNCFQGRMNKHEDYLNSLTVEELHQIWDSTILDYFQEQDRAKKKQILKRLNDVNKKIVLKLKQNLS